MELERIVQYLDGYLGIPDYPDHPHALNGLQVAGNQEVARIAAAVDAAEASIEESVTRGCDLLLAHHGLFWGGLRPLVGRHYRRIAKLVSNRIALYSAHLPLDAHPEVGNCVLLAREIGISPQGRLGRFEGVEIGWWGELEAGRDDLEQRTARAVGGPVRTIPGGPELIRRVAVVTGSGASALEEAAREGMDALITGECSHHNFSDAMELGVNLLLAGHYRTETLGVRALAGQLEEVFGLPWEFIDLPTGL
jgi:dinuclear metal center YbgI/SA1388 family protein